MSNNKTTKSNSIQSELERHIQRQHEVIQAQGVPDYRQRIDALSKLERHLLSQQDEIAEALHSDFGNRSKYETLIAELFIVLNEIKYSKQHLKKWMQAKRVKTDLKFSPARCEIHYQPLGVIGIIGAWNYPVQLTLAPLVNVIAAGNHAIIKPSELAPATSSWLADFIAELFPPEYIRVIEGGADIAAAFSRAKFNHIIFTGSSRVGRIVMQSASENLTPVTLELGGKSPAIMGPDAEIKFAAEKLAIGKTLNAGQTCIAPDYILIDDSKIDSFCEHYQNAVAKLYPSLKANPDYTHIINQAHFERLQHYLSDAKAKGAKVTEINPMGEDFTDMKLFPPHLVTAVRDDMLIMQEEIFGPILPVKGYSRLEQAIAYINRRPNPLALYYFGKDKRDIDHVIEKTQSGGVTINDTLFHFSQTTLPAGGIGESGMGYYRGHHGFLTFSKQKSVFFQSKLSPIGTVFPPYKKLNKKIVQFLLDSTLKS